MFTDYYGLSFNPFDRQCQKKKDCFQSNDFKQMSSRLSYVRGIGVFTAQPGMGKSFCLRCFAKNINRNLGHMEYICLSTVGIREFYYLLYSVPGVEPGGFKPRMCKAVQEQVYYLYHEKSGRCALPLMSASTSLRRS